MHPIRKRRLQWVISIIIGIALACSLALYALKQNINLFYTPSQLQATPIAPTQTIRVGGLVRAGSLIRAKQGLQATFTLTDLKKDLTVTYYGILPDLFREGQGIVAQGHLIAPGLFTASEVLAKHDEKYMPPVVKATLATSTEPVKRG